MSSSRTSTNNRVFWLIAGATIVTTAGLGTIAWPAVSSLREREAERIVTMRQNGQNQAAGYQVAYVVDATNEVAASHVAAQRLAAGDLTGCQQALRTAGQGSLADRSRVQVALEVGDEAGALAAARRLTRNGAGDPDIELAALAYGAIGEGSERYGLIARITSPEAAGRTRRALASNVTLAQELYARGLYAASKRILLQTTVSAARNELLARLDVRSGGHDDLIAASNLYRAAIKLDPARTEPRAGLLETLRRLGETEAADTEAVKLERLTSGRP